MPTTYLTTDELIAINRVVVELSGGSIGLRESNLLESAAFKPQTSFGGEDLYPDLFLKAAVLFEALVNYHVFVDGNKRTGIASLARFMHLNGFGLTLSQNEIVEYAVGVAVDKPDLADIAIWIKGYSKKIKA